MNVGVVGDAYSFCVMMLVSWVFKPKLFVY